MTLRRIEPLAGEVGLYPGALSGEERQPNVGVIRTPQQTILVDAGSSPRHARRLMGELTARDYPPVSTIIYTHHHPGHILGAQVFSAARIIAHVQALPALRGLAAHPWTAALLQEDYRRGAVSPGRYEAMQRALHEVRELRVLPPTIGFDRRLTLFCDDLQVELIHVGGAHAPDSLIVKIPRLRVMFLGDCYAPPLNGEGTPLHQRLDAALLTRLLDEDYALYVDGHQPPYTRAQLQALRGEPG
ncbi:MAG: MBL fold metallo-hydrolase [Anaerolineae bacterium]|jgi:glyoxylase-like metal-dependent hydrolase (beta-lactamase superfamily II)|nr:MBL fold metallo-hydrolase [Anaerolineae bacterium]